MASSQHKLHPIAFELLRHGPPHNQLLSKITDYVALCGNVGAHTLRLPFNHLEHQMNIEALSYHGDSKTAAFKLDEMGSILGDLLGSIPGLPPALSQAKDSKCDMAHLKLMLTPHELALIPFECATVPKGAPGGEGSRLLLQTNAPVTLTREVRGLSQIDVQWPSEPKILFAWASPASVSDVPIDQHLLALRTALNPWIPIYRGVSENAEDSTNFMVKEFRKIVTVIPKANIDDIYQACSNTSYTHVHILAHGVPSTTSGDQQQIGIALHGKRGNDTEIVDGKRLANALRFRHGNNNEMPSMVVLATCNSAQVRSVISYGGSIAHDLHIAGVPLVIASQFPLSKIGSVILTDELYRRVFNAEDPRVAIHYVRRKLFTSCEEYHDWASLVVYASIPNNFEDQLAQLQFKVAKRRVDRLLDEADAMIKITAPSNNPSQREEAYTRLKGTLNKLEGPANEILQRTADTQEALGLQASAKKRKAEILFWLSKQSHITVDTTIYQELITGQSRLNHPNDSK